MLSGVSQYSQALLQSKAELTSQEKDKLGKINVMIFIHWYGVRIIRYRMMYISELREIKT
jgi:hypothetical protein